jgi:serine/threonine protein kinase
LQQLTQHETLLGRYTIERLIGRGGMGAVYLARDTRLGNQVAVKQMAVVGQPDQATQSSLVRAFEREARLLAHLRHPALATVSDYFTDQSSYYLVMQYIPGEDLATLLKNQGHGFSPAEVIRWADLILDALTYLHSQNPPVIHRDIKPQNLKLTPRGELILLDFGLAKGAVGERATGVSGVSLAGYTPLYAPFEQIQGSGTVPQSDLYSLGATLYHLLTGQPPRSALERAAAALRGDHDPLLAPDQLRPGISPTLSGFVLDMMALDPQRRPQSAAAARTLLRWGAVSLWFVCRQQRTAMAGQQWHTTLGRRRALPTGNHLRPRWQYRDHRS